MNCPKCNKSDEVVTRDDGKYCLDCGERVEPAPLDAAACSPLETLKAYCLDEEKWASRSAGSTHNQELKTRMEARAAIFREVLNVMRACEENVKDVATCATSEAQRKD